MIPPASIKITKPATLKSLAEFHACCAALGVTIPAEEITRPSPLEVPAPVRINGKQPGNRVVIHPMEGWDGTETGGVTDEMKRRWQRFGGSGAKMICGAEAMAVRPDGRANPRQLIINRENAAGIAGLVSILKAEHLAKHGTVDDLVIGFQLTHSGRFCRPHGRTMEPRVAFRHPILDRRFNVTSDCQVFTDEEVEALIRSYVQAARIAWEAGADFVDLKHCHGYLLHEFLGAHTRPGKYGGSFENRTRILREIISGIRAEGNPVDLAVRLSLYDMVPHRPDPERSQPGSRARAFPRNLRRICPTGLALG